MLLSKLKSFEKADLFKENILCMLPWLFFVSFFVLCLLFINKRVGVVVLIFESTLGLSFLFFSQFTYYFVIYFTLDGS